MEEKPLLGLCMIVKKEEHVIERAIRSALCMMNTFCIVDTGSTDKTKEIIQKVSDELGIKGFVYDRPWVNFGHNRSEALELAKVHMRWGFMLDADDYIEGEPIDKSLLKDDIGGYYINLHEGNIINKRASLTNLKYDWKYKGTLHEYPIHSSNKEIYQYNKKTYIISKREGFRSNDKQKYLKDALLLQNELDTDPNCDKGRTLFYLAQSYRDAGIKELAIKYYIIRAELKESWNEERYLSYIYLIRLTDNFEEKLSYAWKGQNVISTRNECVYEILSYAHKNKKFLQEIYALGLAFKNNKIDTNHVFIEPESYGYLYYDCLGLQAYYTNHFEEAYEAFKTAYNLCPSKEKSRIQQNIDFSKKHLNIFNNIEQLDIDNLDFAEALSIVATMTTIPSRINELKDTIDSVLNQTIRVNHLEINIPYKCIRTNEEYIVPEWLNSMERVKIFRTEDYGPITKVAPTFMRYMNNDDIYIWSIDDDIIYNTNILELLTDGITSFNEVRGLWSEYRDDPINRYIEVKLSVKYLAGYASILYPPNIAKDDFKEYIDFINNNNKLRYHDDFIIANYLEKHNIKRILYNKDNTRLSGKEYSNSMNALHKIYIDYINDLIKFLQDNKEYYLMSYDLEILIKYFNKNTEEENISMLQNLLKNNYEPLKYKELYNKYINKFDNIFTKYKKYDFTNKNKVNILFTITSCKRFNLFEKTMNSILNTWNDINQIDYFFCVDDNSSDEDRKKMKELYPFFDFYMKDISEKNHRNSMNIIYNKLVELKPTYWIHLEDDWLFYYFDNYVEKSINFLNKYKDQNIHQILFNRNYVQDYLNYDWIGSELLEEGYILHVKSTIQPKGLSNYYWPHYSLRPSMLLADTIIKLGNYNSKNNHFELDYANKYFTNGYKSAFFDRIICKDIGDWKCNSYALNNEKQFNSD